MKIAIPQNGRIDQNILEFIRKALTKAFPQINVIILKEIVEPSPKAFDATRRQYYSSLLLMLVREHSKKTDADKTLGVIDLDLFVPQLNFVFGEAESPGKAAVVSLARLHPEFYGNHPDESLFLERAAKEAVHETGHTFGLAHCSDPSCAMSFSNSIHEVDLKGPTFCPKCSSRLARATG